MTTEDQKTLDLVILWRDAIIKVEPSDADLIWAMSLVYSVMEKVGGEGGKRQLAIDFAKGVEAARKV
jgi:hypothetical protein